MFFHSTDQLVEVIYAGHVFGRCDVSGWKSLHDCRSSRRLCGPKAFCHLSLSTQPRCVSVYLPILFSVPLGSKSAVELLGGGRERERERELVGKAQGWVTRLLKTFLTFRALAVRHTIASRQYTNARRWVISKETVGYSWDILNATFGHEYRQNHSKSKKVHI